MAPQDNTRTVILQAALNLVAANGFHGTSMSKVAKEAQISAATIYHYFEGKDKLINELYRTIKVRLMQAVLAGQDEGLPLREQMRHLIRNLMCYLLEHPQEAAFMEQYDRSPYNQPAIQAELAAYYDRIGGLVGRARQEQIIKDLPDPILETLTFDVASSLARKYATGSLVVSGEIIEQVVDACWDAMRR